MGRKMRSLIQDAKGSTNAAIDYTNLDHEMDNIFINPIVVVSHNYMLHLGEGFIGYYQPQYNANPVNNDPLLS